MLEASLEGSAETWFAFCFLVVPRGMQGLKSPPSHPPPPTRDRTVPAAVEARSPKHWTAREFPAVEYFKYNHDLQLYIFQKEWILRLEAGKARLELTVFLGQLPV